jgi:uncharacterized protein (DUF1330 family)
VEYACHPGVGLGGNGDGSESQQGEGDRAHGDKYSFVIDPDVGHPPRSSFEKKYYSGGIREGNQMKKGYWVVAYRTVGDEATMKNYVELARAALGQFGARTLVSPKGAVTAHEAGLEKMTVVVEFDSYEIALAAYESADYKKALVALGSSVERDLRIVEGI